MNTATGVSKNIWKENHCMQILDDAIFTWLHKRFIFKTQAGCL